MRKLILVTIFLLFSSTTQTLYAVPYTITDLGFRLDKASINNNSQIAGSRSFTGQGLATLWENGTVTDVGTPSVTTQSSAWDINDAAQIVGGDDALSSGGAYLWENGVTTNLGTLPWLLKQLISTTHSINSNSY